MKTLLTNNWMAKLLCLLLAIAIWFLIKKHLEENGGQDTPPRAIPVKEPIR